MVFLLQYLNYPQQLPVVVECMAAKRGEAESTQIVRGGAKGQVRPTFTVAPIKTKDLGGMPQ